MTDDLVPRLREMGEHPCRADFPIGADLREAADRIEALEAENGRLRERAEHYSDQWTAVGTKGQAIIDQLCAENKQAHDALSDLLHAVCGEKGFAEAVRRDSGRIYPWPALELAEAKARKILEQSK